MNKWIKLGLGVAVGGTTLVALTGAGAWWWMTSAANAKLAVTYETHTVELAVPFPLSGAELDELRTQRTAELAAAAPAPATDAAAAVVDPLEGLDLDAIALERALARGKHLVSSRYVCVECHGANFGGGTMIDDPAIGRLLGPNLTTGSGSRTTEYTVADWDRIVRHGVLPDGRPAVMPSDDFVSMSDRELSDIVAYIRSMPAVDNAVEKSSFGPIGTMLMATGKMPISAEKHHDHMAPHAVEPPTEAPTADFGKHLAQVCTGCHRADFDGGPMPFGPPDWPAAGNLTPSEDGVKAWTYDDFAAAMRTGKRPDGTEFQPPMSLMVPYAAGMKDVELQAMWAYFQTLAPLPDGT